MERTRYLVCDSFIRAVYFAGATGGGGYREGLFSSLGACRSLNMNWVSVFARRALN